MATIIEEKRETYPSDVKNYEKAAKTVTGGAVGEGLGGAATIVLTILGLAQLFPQPMSAVAGLVVGAALMWEGGLIATQYNKLVEAGFPSRTQFTAGMGAQFFGGAIGCVLGILSLLGIYPTALVSIAAIVYGGVLGASSLASYTVDVSLPWKEGKSVTLFPGGVGGAAGFQVMAGFASGILGILALVGLAPITLNLVAMLCVGSAIMFSGTAVSARIFKNF